MEPPLPLSLVDFCRLSDWTLRSSTTLFLLSGRRDSSPAHISVAWMKLWALPNASTRVVTLLSAKENLNLPGSNPLRKAA